MSLNLRPSGSGAQCPTHPDMNLIEDYSTGDLTRPECGLVVGDRMVETGSDRTLSKDKSAGDPSRVGSEKPLLIGGHLSTPIGRSSTQVAFGESRVPKNRKRKHISSSDRELMSAFREVSDMSDRIHVSQDIIDRAHHLFKQVHDRRALKGRRNAAVCTACLYIACRQGVVPRTFKEICAVSKVSKKEIGRCFQSILKALNISLDSITNEDFMSRFCATLGLPSSVQSAATHIARKAVELDIVPGLSPMSVTAAAIYMASQASEDKKCQKEIADIAGVSDVTIRQSYKLMVAKAKELFPPDFNFFTPIETLPQL